MSRGAAPSSHAWCATSKLVASASRCSSSPTQRPSSASAAIGADIVELHTGAYCEKALEDDAEGVAAEIEWLARAAKLAAGKGLEVHAGHGLTFSTVAAIARMPEIVELNIGHFLIGEAIFGGLSAAIRHMRALMDEARSGASQPRERVRPA